MDFLDSLEWFSVIMNLAFVVLLIKEQKLAWPFGIMGSLVSIYLFVITKLYSEAILYSYYVVMGFYGWYIWSREKENGLAISEWHWLKHLGLIVFGFFCSIGLGYFFDKNTDAAMPYADAFSTVFSFIATYLEAKKVLSTWIFWMILNSFSIWLYHSRGLEIYAALMIVYTVLSVVGFLAWRKSYNAQSTG